MTSLLLAMALTAAPMQLRSDSFKDAGPIPAKNTCSGQDVSPALAWSNVPVGTRTLAVVVDDPTAHHFTHWLLYDLPTNLSGLPEAMTPALLPVSAREGLNDFGKLGWRGPCPPIGEHRYVFTVYALDAALP